MKPVSLVLATAALLAGTVTPTFASTSSDPSKVDVDAVIQEGYLLDRQGEYKQAEDKFSQVLSVMPDDQKAHYLLANTYFRDQQMANARREMETVIRLGGSGRMLQDAKGWLQDNADQAPGAKVTTLIKGTVGYVNGALAQARFRTPMGLAVGPMGALYVADAGNHCLRKITSDGKVSTVAGTGQAGYADGPAMKARLGMPRGLAADPAGNLFFCDGNRIRFMTPNALIGTLAGNVDAGTADGDWKTARFSSPTALAVDEHGRVFVADNPKAPEIRMVMPDGTTHLLAGGHAAGSNDGNGASAQFKQITALQVAANGTLLVLDSGNNRIRRVSTDGTVATVPGNADVGWLDGPIALAHFRKMAGSTIDAAGDIFIADQDNHAIREVLPSGDVLTIAGGVGASDTDGVGLAAAFSSPAWMAGAGKTLYVLDGKTYAIRKIELLP